MRKSLLIALLGLLALTGCRSWRVSTAPTAQVLSEEQPDQIRVARISDSSEVVLHQPTIIGDSLRGLPTALAIQAMMIPLADIREVAVRRFDLGKTLFRSFLVVGAVALYELLFSLNEGPTF